MKRTPLLPVLLLWALAGCDGTDTYTAETDAEAFARSEAIPAIQSITVVLDVPEQHVTLFRITYGEDRPHLCLDLPRRGCYSDAFALQYKGKFGWLAVYDRWGDVDMSRLSHYEPTPQDSYLYTEAFFNKLKAADELLYQQAFLPLLAAREDTPPDVLLRISHGLYTYINPSLAMTLLGNRAVRDDSAMLSVLADLPVFQGDAYEEAREQAKSLLDGMD